MRGCLMMKQTTIDFLKNLQQKLNAQETIQNEDPTFWVIMDYKWFPTNDKRGEKRIKCPTLDKRRALSKGQLTVKLGEYIIDNGINATQSKKTNQILEARDVTNDFDRPKISDLDRNKALLDYLGLEYEIVYETLEGVIAPNTLFFTREEAEQHLIDIAEDINLTFHPDRYHKNAHPFTMTAWRSPEIQQLMTILMTEDFES